MDVVKLEKELCTLERDIVTEIEKLIMGKTAPKGHEIEWLLLYLAAHEIRALRAGGGRVKE